jgi:RNA polymerase sigma-70 factor (ECF subfamily)
MEGKEGRARDRYSDLVALYSERIFNLALRMLRNRENAEEATQDVFVKVFKSMENFRGESSLSTWIWKITMNVCFSYLRKKKINSVNLEDAGIDPPDEQTGNFSNQENMLYHDELSITINKYISMLPANESAAITLFYLEGMSYEEISEILKAPIGTISIALHRGRKRLREMLKKKKEEI